MHIMRGVVDVELPELGSAQLVHFATDAVRFRDSTKPAEADSETDAIASRLAAGDRQGRRASRSPG
jgi:hypothetical protein